MTTANFVREHMMSQSIQDQSSALIDQISTLNLGKKEKKVKDISQLKPKARFQPVRNALVNKNLNEVLLSNKVPTPVIPKSQNTQQRRIMMGRETCPPMGGLGGLNDIDRDIMMQSQFIEGTSAV